MSKFLVEMSAMVDADSHQAATSRLLNAWDAADGELSAGSVIAMEPTARYTRFGTHFTAETAHETAHDKPEPGL